MQLSRGHRYAVILCGQYFAAERTNGMARKPILKQFGDLQASDFARQPVWVSVHTLDNEEPWYDDTDEEEEPRLSTLRNCAFPKGVSAKVTAC